MTKRTKPLADSSKIPRLEPPLRLTDEEAALLSKHFEAFADTTNKLVAAQQHLQEQLHVLMGELERKNRELESVNAELGFKMRETEEVRQFLDRLIDSMRTGLAALDSDGAVTKMNRCAAEILGWVDSPPPHFESLLPSGAENPLGLIDAEGADSRSGEIRLVKKDGDAVLVRYTLARIEKPADSEAEMGEFLFVFEDLSHLRLLEERVRRSDRLTALGELAAGVAHEMRNPLATMRGFLQLLPNEYEDPEFREECSTRLIGEIDRLARLTDDLLELSRPIRPDNCATDLCEVIENLLGEQRDSLESQQIAVRLDLRKIPSLPLDRDRMKQVLLNLVINASQALPEGGTISLSSGLRRDVWGEEDEQRELVFVTVADDGIGIEPKHLESLFDPFFTTKGRGTGLGLALCHRIVEEHGGVIRVESSPGRGASFTLFFPLPNEG